MRILVFDTETTSLPDRKLPFTAPSQPHILELGWLRSPTGVASDPTMQDCVLLRPPPDAALHPAALAAHGISLEEATADGVPPRAAFHLFLSHVRWAECLVGHNLEFDLLMMRILAARLDLWEDLEKALHGKATFCTMINSTALCRLPRPDGRPGWKWPTLAEAHQALLGRPFEGAHRALADVLAAWAIFHAINAHTDPSEEGGG